MSSYRVRQRAKRLSKRLTSILDRHAASIREIRALHERKIEQLMAEMARQRYEQESRGPSVWHRPWNHPPAPINTPVTDRHDMRPRLLCRTFQVDPQIISSYTRRLDEKGMLNHIEREATHDLARKLVEDGFVRIDWAQQAGVERYGDRRVDGGPLYFHWAVYVSQAHQVKDEPINPSYKFKGIQP